MAGRHASPSVSVVIPCYNAAAFLGETIASVLCQTVQPLEILLIDDGSTDGSADIAAAHPLVQVVQQPNRGESVARNRGIEAARGDWVALLDADDLWMPTKLERQLASVTSDVVACHTNFLIWDGHTTTTVDLSKIPPAARYRLERLVGGGILLPSSLVVRRDLSLRFPEWTRYGEDLVYSFELSLLGAITLVPEPLTVYRRHRDGQSTHPSAPLFWHATTERWLAEHAAGLTPATVRGVREYWINRLTDSAREAKWARRRDEYWALRHHLAEYGDWPQVAELMSRPIHPRWVYWLLDPVVRAYRRATRRTLISQTD